MHLTELIGRLQSKATKLRRQALSEDLSDDDRMVSAFIIMSQLRSTD